MAAHVSSEKIDLLVYGPHKPIVDKDAPQFACVDVVRNR